MSTNIIEIGKCSIDSLKLRFELSDLNSFDKSLMDTLTVSNPNGEIEDEFKRRSKKYHSDHYSFYASIKNQRVSKDKFTDCLTVLINSKQLKDDYFKGITNETISSIHHQLKEFGILDCSLDTFLFRGSPTDIDFKKDYRLPLADYKELIKVCKIMTKESNNRDKGCTLFSLGIAWSIRETSKYLTHPYLKIYHKETELNSNDTIEFTDKYLRSFNLKNLFRIETTIKNRTHLKALKLGLKQYNLKELLSLSDDQKNTIISNAVNCHLSSRNKSMTFKTESNMTPTDRIKLNALLSLITEFNYSIDRSIKVLLNGIENRGSKSLNKSKLLRLYNDHIKDTNYDSKITKIESIFDSFGWQ